MPAGPRAHGTPRRTFCRKGLCRRACAVQVAGRLLPRVLVPAGCGSRNECILDTAQTRQIAEEYCGCSFVLLRQSKDPGGACYTFADESATIAEMPAGQAPSDFAPPGASSGGAHPEEQQEIHS